MFKKYGLTVGINDYPGTSSDLSGCVNDAMDMRHFLEDHDVDVETLIDARATKSAILEAMTRLVKITGYRDTLYIHYSGHGTWIPDRNGDEVDGRDEALVAYDFQNGGLITDDELYDVFKQRKFGSRIFFFSDSCFSGTVTRGFDFVEPETHWSRPASDKKKKFLPPNNFLTGYELARATVVQFETPKTTISRNSGILISGCAEYEYSYDAWFNNRPNGAFTKTLLDAYQPGMTSRQWHAAVRKILPSDDYDQRPQLQGTWWQKNRWKVFR